jgi:succinate dehydrogenase/fumarate reductase-like Fe-S protein
MYIQKILQEFENELNDFSIHEDQLNDKEELLNCFNKLKEVINYTRCCREVFCGYCNGYGYTVDENGRRKEHCKECEY